MTQLASTSSSPIASGREFAKSARNALAGEFGRYFVVSLLALLADMLLFSLGHRKLGLPVFSAASLGFFVGATVAYILSINWVFTARRLNRRPGLEFAVFVVVGLFGLCVTQLVLWVGVGVLRITPEVVKLHAAAISFVCNYLARKLVLFNRSERATLCAANR